MDYNNQFKNEDLFNITKRKLENEKDTLIIQHRNIEIWNCFYRQIGVSYEEFNAIENSVRNELINIFEKLKPMVSILNVDEAINFYTDILKFIFDLHANNVKCFSKAKTQNINGMNLEQLLKFHENKFRTTLKMHMNVFKCYDNIEMNKENSSNEILQNITSKAKVEIEKLFKNIMKEDLKLSSEQIFQIHLLILKEVILFHIEYVPCFKIIKTEGINKMKVEDILNMHKNRFTKVYNIHIDTFECNK